MKPYIPLHGGTLLISTDPDNPESKHLFVLLTDPFESNSSDSEMVLLVPFCTVRQGLFIDGACVFTKKDKVHPFIKSDTFVHYRFARLESAESVIEKVKSGEFISKAPVDEGCVMNICDGLRKSPHVSQRCLSFLDEYEADGK